ncbi:AAA domain-containing protein [uncultured Clostridium sp.]|uniref:AAA domain-containing protein n=1 Tax=uncultured Clostridium sp. TaxID=59620 RepID=UPI0028F07D0F|nr:AAA domain-containing protein [uncultured Clostridium sp.]
MEARTNVKNVFNYLLNLKSINEDIIRDVKGYNKIFWDNQIIETEGCTLHKDKTDDCYIVISKKAKNIYDYLFKLYIQFEKSNNNLEIIYASDLFACIIDGKKVIHPIFTTPVELDFRPEVEKFYLRLNNSVNLELQFFQGLEVEFESIINLEKELQGGKEYFCHDNIRKYYNVILDAVEKNNICKKEENIYSCGCRELTIKDKPSIINEGLIIIREINTNLWKEDIKKIVRELDNGTSIPKSLTALVEEDVVEENNEEWMNLKEDILFPLPSNREQKEVARALAENYGVVVQGAPGTGKSHTIANLICHLLAHGKRVLVTSERGRALKVLEDKIPEEIRPLCISLLGSDSRELKELEDSVRVITDNMSVNPRILYDELISLEKDLNNCRKSINDVIEQLKNLDRREREIISYCGNDYTLADIAKWIKENEEEYSWIEDYIDIDMKSPLSEEEFESLKLCIKKMGNNNFHKYSNILPIIDQIPSYEELYKIMSDYIKLKEKYENNIESLQGWGIYCKKTFDYNRAMKTIDYAINEIVKINDAGLGEILKIYNNSDFIKDNLFNLLIKWENNINRIKNIRKEINNSNISLPEKIDFIDLKMQYEKIYKELIKRGRISKLFYMMNKECRYILDNSFVDGMPLENLSQGLIIKLYMEEKSIEENSISLWNNTFKMYNNLTINKDCNEGMITLEKYMMSIKTIVNWNEKVRLEISNSLGDIKYPSNLDWYEESTFTRLKERLKSIKEIYEYRELDAKINCINNMLNNYGEFKELIHTIEELNIDELKMAYEEVCNLKNIKSSIVHMDNISCRVKETCPKLYKKLLKGNIDKLNNWNRAWRWRKWNSVLDKLEEINKIELEEKLENEKEKERQIIKEIICKKTWYNQISKISESEKRSLFTWIQSVKRIGKGKGKYVDEYVKSAQKELNNCKEIIPVWIMPLDKVIENIDVSSNKFDVIIFDESSQSNIFSLCGLMRAERAVIVGDDRQISPEAVGVDQGKVRKIINTYLKEIPHGEWFDLQTSLYDTALRVFPARIVLKEHFRCVEEIVEFSNKYCYSGEITPLRYAYKYERLEPAINAIKIEEGRRDEKKVINIKEGEAIVEKIYELCKDRNYRGMTMGVISLLGEEQAQYIEGRLREKIGEEEMVKRKIICGDAYSFQGDERDVMFLSMVVGENIKFASLTKDSDIRRFNVAASRAKNQMWVFYSIDVQTLNKDCVRYSLLNYCLNYKDYKKEKDKVEYVFYSDIQKEVYNRLCNMGFNPYLNLKIGGIKVDFILENLKNKVAIICSDEWKNSRSNWSEVYEDKFKLKTLGWHIIEVRNIEFYRRPEKLMKEVHSSLEVKGIVSQKNSKELRVV